ncbi:ATP-dependent DNA helicase [Candidatus Poriferisodalis sp.]|uniref:ATP-dependent DNA helicase n=1 Tax=Candidatus Poriferisodalis sp. TaxID=3101277 RepID=UPI003B021130
MSDEPTDLAPATGEGASDIGDVAAALGEVIAGLPGGGEQRDGQAEMAAAVHDVIAAGGTLLCQAGTGVGKSLAYLVPAALAAAAGKRVVIATATLALQDQLVGKDLPLVASGMAQRLGRPVRWEVLKGRNNYLCRHRLGELAQQQFDLGDGPATPAELARQQQLAEVSQWVTRTRTGDRAELAIAPDARVWSSVSVTSTECIGAERCPEGHRCFAEEARARSAKAGIVVTNQHLYCIDLFGDGYLFGPHDAVVFDEAHQLEPVVTQVAGLEITPAGFTRLAAEARSVGAAGTAADAVADVSNRLADELGPLRDTRLGAITGDLASLLEVADSRVVDLAAELRSAGDDAADLERLRVGRIAAESLTALRAALDPPQGTVILVEGRGRLRLAPLDVGDLLASRLWGRQACVLTSATLGPHFVGRLGVPAADHAYLAVDSPFDYRTNALLYCARHLPAPTNDAYRAAAIDELAELVAAIGGRTLALFTSWRALNDTADALTERFSGIRVLRQGGELSNAALLDALGGDPATVVCGTMSFWQGVDVAGPALSLLAIDRLPFARPNEPLAAARREAAGSDAFMTVDVPNAADMLAQGVGRLIRTTADRGVVAVLDSRLATAGYRPRLLDPLPPMRRSVDQADAVEFLASIRNQHAAQRLSR